MRRSYAFTGILLGLIFINVGMAQRPAPACTVTQISTAAEWRQAHPYLPFRGTKETKLMVTMRCPDKRKLVDLADDFWPNYARDKVQLAITREAYDRMWATGDIPPLRGALTAQGGIQAEIPAEAFITWAHGFTGTADVLGHVFYAFTGCPWARPGDIDPRQCVPRPK